MAVAAAYQQRVFPGFDDEPVPVHRLQLLRQFLRIVVLAYGDRVPSVRRRAVVRHRQHLAGYALHVIGQVIRSVNFGLVRRIDDDARIAGNIPWRACRAARGADNPGQNR